MRWFRPSPKADRAALRRRRSAFVVAGGLLILLSDPLLLGQAARLRWVPGLSPPLLHAWQTVAPADPVGHFAAGLEHRKAGRTDAALQSFEKAVRLNSRLGPAQAYLGEALFEAGRFEDAYRITQQCTDEHPGLPMALVVLGRLHARRGDWHKAAPLAQQALEGDPRLVEAWVLSARVSEVREDWTSCRAAAERAVRLNPRLASGWVLLSHARLRLGEGAGALDSAREARRLAPELTEAQIRLAAGLLSTGSPAAREEAVEVLNQVPASGPLTGTASALLAQAQLSLGRRDQALPQALEVIRRWPLENGARATAAECYAAAGDQSRANHWRREHARWQDFLDERWRLEQTKFTTTYDQRIHLQLARRMAEVGLWKEALREGETGMRRISQPPAGEFLRRLQAAYSARHDPPRKAQALESLEEPLRQLAL